MYWVWELVEQWNLNYYIVEFTFMDKIVLIVIVLNVILSFRGFENRQFFNRYQFLSGAVVQKDWIRFISSGFLHVDFYHLLFNMLSLYFFAGDVIRYFGRFEFLFIYLASIVGGNAIAYYFHKNEPHYAAVGASGGVMGVLYAYILLYPFSKMYLFFIPIGIPAILVGVAYLAYSIFGMKNQWGNIGHAAHLGGAITGLLISLLYEPGLLESRTYIVVVLCIPLVLLYLYREKLNV